MAKPLVIYGAGGFGREVATLVESINRQSRVWDLKGFVTDDPAEYGKWIDGYQVLGSLAQVSAQHSGPLAVTAAIGSPSVLSQRMKALQCEELALEFPSLVHPGAVLDRARVRMGHGCIVASGCLFTLDIRLGDFVVINMGSIVAHDVIVDDYSILSPGTIVNGAVRIERCCLVGAGAVLMPRITIGEGATVALGAVVGTDVPPYAVVAGNPARIVRRLEPMTEFG